MMSGCIVCCTYAVVLSGVCRSVVFSTQVCLSVFRVIWYEFLMTSAIKVVLCGYQYMSA